MSFLEYRVRFIPRGARKILHVNWALVVLLTTVASVGFLMLTSAAGGDVSRWAEPHMVRFAAGLVACRFGEEQSRMQFHLLVRLHPDLWNQCSAFQSSRSPHFPASETYSVFNARNVEGDEAQGPRPLPLLNLSISYRELSDQPTLLYSSAQRASKKAT